MKTDEYWEYLQKRRQMNKTNYYLESLREIEQIRREFDHKPRLLLHACCAVCAGWPLEFLCDVFAITIYYANSNIWPAAEYSRRLAELERFVKEVYGDAVDIIVPPYDNAAYTKKLEPLKDDPEGFRRCAKRRRVLCCEGPEALCPDRTGRGVS